MEQVAMNAAVALRAALDQHAPWVVAKLSEVPQILPTPLSPLFQAGGPLDFLCEDVALTMFFIAALFILDNIFVKPCIHSKARYFALHIAANTVSTIASYPDMMRAFVHDPLNAFGGASYSQVANSAASAIHLYHVLAFKLRSDDIFHHLSFVIALCGLAIPYKQTGGVANNLGCFFLCGLPGALNYLFLVLYYHGMMSRASEKRWTARVNVWMRGPAMSVYAFLGFQAWLRGIHEVPLIALILVVFLHFTNGQYYAAQAVESLTKHSINKGKEEDGSSATTTKTEGKKLQ